MKRSRAPEGVGSRPETCLYYPYYEVREEAWVKEALLYWDMVATIVPVDVDPRGFKGSLYRELAEHDAVEAWPVSGWVRDETARRVLDLVDAGKHSQLPEGPPFLLNFGKLSTELTEGLQERGLEAKRKGSEVEVDFQVGALVMCTLAHHLGERTQSRAVTDDHALGAAFISVLSATQRTQNLEEVISRDLQVAVPDLRNINLSNWLEFRSKHPKELSAYRTAVDSLAREIAGAEDPAEAESVLDRRQQQLEEAVNQGVWRRLTSDRTLSKLSLVVGLPSVAVDLQLGVPLVTGVLGGAITIKQLLRKEIHGLTFVQQLHDRFR